MVNGASFLLGIQENSWVTITGSKLSSTSRTWIAETEIVNGRLPTSLDGVSATIDGKPASMCFISPGQINVLAPTDSSEGPVELKATNANGTSAAVFAQLQKFSPSFFLFDPQDRKYIAALIARTDGKVDYLGPASLIGSALATRPAKPGEIILLYGTGFGPTNPSVPSGMVFNVAAQLTENVTVTIGGVTATVQFAGVTGAGLYQFNVVVPNLPDGDQKVVATIGGLSSQDNRRKKLARLHLRLAGFGSRWRIPLLAMGRTPSCVNGKTPLPCTIATRWMGSRFASVNWRPKWRRVGAS